MITADEALGSLQRQIDDTDGEQFSRSRLLEFLQDGYDRLCRQAECLFDAEVYDTQPRAANYTRDFERQFIEGPVHEKFNCTRESDAEFMEGDALVSNHTRPSDAEYMTEEGHTPTVTGLRRLPEGYVSIDRVLHDTLRLEPEHDRYNRLSRTDYQTLQGGVFIYQMDQDGWGNMRLVNVPAYTLLDQDEYTYEDGDHHHGTIRSVDGSYDTDDEVVIGSYGAIRSIPGHFPTGTQYGVIRRVIPEGPGDKATKVEYYRLGRPLSEHPFEIPDRMVKYVIWWALHRVYGVPGEMENKKLAEHFKLRYELGIGRLKVRVRNAMRERTIAMGSKRTSIRDNYLEHFPADYGYSRPFRR
jgi:hypothetical protein